MDNTNFLLWPSPHHGCQLEVRNKAPNLHNLKSSLIKEQNFPLQNMKLCLVSFLNLPFSNLMGKLFLLPPWNHKFLEDRKPIIPIHLSIFNGHSLSISRVNIILGPCLSVSESGWVISLGLTQFWAQVGRVGGGGEHQYRGSQRYWSWQQLHTSWTRHCWRGKKHKKLNSIKFMRWHERGNPIVAMKASLQGKTNGVLCQVESKPLMQGPR